MKVQDSFIKKVSLGLKKCGVNLLSIKIGCAVSGGADSVSLFLSLVELFGSENVFAITVNHNIRAMNETKGDADFVVALCKKFSVSCKVFEIERGKIESLSNVYGGTEAAARALRYEVFENFIEENGLEFLCLAHNQNDQLETSIMRFLQGSGSDGGGGISFRRGKFIRPLLNISRAEIENFLNSRNQNWRTDMTNFDESYLRNRIRNSLIPQLDELFPGWRKSVLNGVEKNSDDNSLISRLSDEFFHDGESLEKIEVIKNKISILRKEFERLDISVKRRVIQDSFLKLNFNGRFPYKLIREIFSWNDGKNHSVNFDSIKINVDSKYLTIERNVQKSDEKETSAIESGFFRIVNVFDLKSGRDNKFIFRSLQNGDEIEMKDGSMKSISKIFSEWKVSTLDRNRITIVQDIRSMKNVAILGKTLGYNDWVVSDYGFCFSTADN